MKPSEIGRRLGIGVRVAGRIATEAAQDRTAHSGPGPGQAVPRQTVANLAAEVRGAQSDMRQQVTGVASRASRSAGRGVGGFLRPFSRVGGILWLEVTGFFFGMFAAWFALDLWKARQSYVHGPDHQRFLIDCALTALFVYLCVSSFLRAQRR